MLQIKEIVNSVFTSKSYILYHNDEATAWLVDIGDIEPVVAFLEEKGLIVRGLFLTHAHFDHMYGILNLLERFPNCKVFVTPYTKEALASEKLNLSKYHEAPIKYEGDNIIVVHEGDSLNLFENEPDMFFHETPGHNPGCLTMIVGDVIFTGDAYIPGVGANTQPPLANKELAKKSLERILKLADGKKILSGHQLIE